MIESSEMSTKERLLEAATGLFASKGYAATSVADIQLACGLTGGSGALYKHFRSKRALLEAIVDRHVATMAGGGERFLAELPDDPRQALRLMVTAVWTGIDRDREPLRVLLRDLDPFPDLLERMWRGVLGFVYGGLTSWVVGECERGRLTVADPAATSAVLFASLTYYRLLDVLIGRVPGDIDPERFADAWVDHAAVVLGVP
ncbi:TetR/AcrR family transcriptional regulator [Pseudonocardia spinosispora]|uniref:TetR/AcrR family transcriptional regulator n=1 Tax=Pseudonocardia spinosispora TaxID=103441 RepID=UPI00042062F1|nr:TetR/AcrR family transcriptional regulator [Pseudonocardia spinosispora]